MSTYDRMLSVARERQQLFELEAQVEQEERERRAEIARQARILAAVAAAGCVCWLVPGVLHFFAVAWEHAAELAAELFTL